MPEAVVEEFDESDLLPEDVLFTGALIKVTDREAKWDDKYTGQPVRQMKWVWVFKITEGEYQGRTARGETFASLRTGNQAYEWITALNGGNEPEVGANINTDHYLGTGCTFEVTHRPYKSRDGKDKTAVEVSRVYPSMATSTPPF